MLYKRRTPNIFPDPDASIYETVWGAVDWSYTVSCMSGLPIHDPENPDDIADMTSHVGNLCGYDAEKLHALQEIIKLAMSECRLDYT